YRHRQSGIELVDADDAHGPFGAGFRPPPWDRRCRRRLRNVFCRAATKRCDRAQHDLAMTEEDAELFEIGLAQLRQYRKVDGIVAERLGVPLQRERAQSVGDLQGPSRSSVA